MIAVSVSGAVVTVRLSRPEKLNALNRAMLRQLREALDRAAEDADLRVLVLTGEGRAFCTGQDLSEIAAEEVSAVLAEEYAPLVEKLLHHGLVTIAALNGMAVGAGASVALACDFAVAAERASIAHAFVKIGLIPDAGATWLLPRVTGLRNALALALTGDSVTAREAQAMGLIYRVFADERFEEEVAALAGRIAANSPLACQLIKQSLRESMSNGLAEQLALESWLQGEAAQSQPFRNALAAFLARGK